MNSDDMDDDREELISENETETDATDKESLTDAVVEKASSAARKLEPVVLAHVLAPKYQPVKPRVIAKQLHLPSEQHRALKLAIRPS
jgi:ribonuclease R